MAFNLEYCSSFQVLLTGFYNTPLWLQVFILFHCSEFYRLDLNTAPWKATKITLVNFLLFPCHFQLIVFVWKPLHLSKGGLRQTPCRDLWCGRVVTVNHCCGCIVKIRHKADSASAPASAPATSLIHCGRQEVSLNNFASLHTVTHLPMWTGETTAKIWVAGEDHH